MGVVVVVFVVVFVVFVVVFVVVVVGVVVFVVVVAVVVANSILVYLSRQKCAVRAIEGLPRNRRGAEINCVCRFSSLPSAAGDCAWICLFDVALIVDRVCAC